MLFEREARDLTSFKFDKTNIKSRKRKESSSTLHFLLISSFLSSLTSKNPNRPFPLHDRVHCEVLPSNKQVSDSIIKLTFGLIAPRARTIPRAYLKTTNHKIASKLGGKNFSLFGCGTKFWSIIHVSSCATYTYKCVT